MSSGPDPGRSRAARARRTGADSPVSASGTGGASGAGGASTSGRDAARRPCERTEAVVCMVVETKGEQVVQLRPVSHTRSDGGRPTDRSNWDEEFPLIIARGRLVCQTGYSW